MSISIVIEVFIGLFLLFFVLSNMVSAINEMIGNLLQRRTNNLADFIVDILKPGDLMSTAANAQDAKSAEKKPEKLVQAFYNSSVIRSKKKDGIWLWSVKVANSQNVASIADRDFPQAVLEIIDFAKTTHKDAAAAFQALEDGVQTLPAGSPLRTALTNAINQADADISKVTSQLEAWFNGQMEILSDLYKRRTQLWLFVIGFIIALLFNIDTFAVAGALKDNPAMRDSIVERANAIVAQDPTLSNGDSKQKWNDAISELNAVNLPIGLGQELFPVSASSTQNLSKLIGLLVTAAAASLGAPFWYDLLKMLTSSRPSSAKSDSGGSSG